MSIVDAAKSFAIQVHGSQKYGQKPYQKHLEDTVQVLKDFGISDEILLASGWLHDTIEDTSISKFDIHKIFGGEIAEIVWCLTDEQGKSRKERKEKTYHKLRLNNKAITVKLADRIANTNYSLLTSEKMFLMYKKEYSKFKEELFNNENWLMWQALDIMYTSS